MRHDIVVYSLHTCLDRGKNGISMNDWLVNQLGVHGIECYDHYEVGKKAILNQPMEGNTFIKKVKETFHLEHVKYSKNTNKTIEKIAICGGSAIAAVGPVLRAKDSEMSVALGTIFILNAIALFIFPMIGHALSMDQQQFGTWAAIAIHDTSSVVGAGAAYGEEALKVATTIKLTRALWIIPMAFATSFIFKSKGQKISIPWFIFFFVLAMIVNTYLLGSVPEVGAAINGLARKTLTITMFFIGASLSIDVVKSVGLKPLVQGVLLWVVISCSTLAYIYWF